jgi:hypothetical protein
MDIYRHMIEELWKENRSLLALLNIATVPGSQHAAIPRDLCRDGAHAIRRLTDQNEALRESLSEQFSGKELDRHLCA